CVHALLHGASFLKSALGRRWSDTVSAMVHRAGPEKCPGTTPSIYNARGRVGVPTGVEEHRTRGRAPASRVRPRLGGDRDERSSASLPKGRRFGTDTHPCPFHCALTGDTCHHPGTEGIRADSGGDRLVGV